VLLCLRLCKGLVSIRIHKSLHILDSLLIDSHLGNPAATCRVILGNLVDSAWCLLQCRIDVCDLTADGRVDICSALDRLYGANGIAGLDLLSLLGELDVDNIAESLGCVFADADDAGLAIRR
jgi:hypothetical protein